jgi:predicted nucleic acid-binding Zn ribbon protein
MTVPKYDYECGWCLVQIEVTALIGSAPEDIKCTCGGTLTRTYTAPNVIFRGTGWGKDKK